MLTVIRVIIFGQEGIIASKKGKDNLWGWWLIVFALNVLGKRKVPLTSDKSEGSELLFTAKWIQSHYHDNLHESFSYFENCITWKKNIKLISS